MVPYNFTAGRTPLLRLKFRATAQLKDYLARRLLRIHDVRKVTMSRARD